MKVYIIDFKTSIFILTHLLLKVVEPNKKGWLRIKKHFSDDDVFNDDGTLNRDKIGQIIFSNAKKRQLLNKCLHNLILFEIIKQLLLYLIKGHRYIILDVPLLFEFKLGLSLISYKIVVFCNEDEQIKRLLVRNKNLNENEAKNRIKSQMKNEDRLRLADFVIDNSSDVENTRIQIEKLNEVFVKSKRYIPARLVIIGILFSGLFSLIFYHT